MYMKPEDRLADLAWDKILNNTVAFGATFQAVKKVAGDFGYKYFLWNEGVFETNSGLHTGFFLNKTENKFEYHQAHDGVLQNTRMKRAEIKKEIARLQSELETLKVD